MKTDGCIGESPSNAYFRKKYGPSFHGAAAQAGGSEISFWQGTTNFRQPVFDHEQVGPA